MDVMETIKTIFFPIIVPLVTALVSLGWYMFKKQGDRLDHLEQRTSETEKAIIEIKTEFKFISRDIKDIKDILVKLSDK